jgi:hypothetical protein
MILHELCHALVAGQDSMAQADWGLEYERPQDEIAEHAALRLQATLAGQFGLRDFLAATTVYRAYYESLPADPLADDGDPAVELAQVAWQRAVDGAWADHLNAALRATRQIADAVAHFAPSESIWRIR